MSINKFKIVLDRVLIDSSIRLVFDWSSIGLVLDYDFGLGWRHIRISRSNFEMRFLRSVNFDPIRFAQITRFCQNSNLMVQSDKTKMTLIGKKRILKFERDISP